MVIPPVEVQHYGQSIWTDNISRRLIASGALERLVTDNGVMGVTSNPTIFQKAIGETADYDDQIQAMLTADATTIYEALAVRDIQVAADILKPVYDRTSGVDGYVSLEVSPLLANDTEETLTEAKRLFAAVDRPNVMIKIPATRAGIPAIEEAIAAGINVNVTLIFSVENYKAVAEAYIKGLERRLEAGENVTQIASVASFFVSRIDKAVDTMLENNIRESTGRNLDRLAANRKLLGQAAIANAKLAYRAFQGIFEGTRFARLRDAGAMVQRPLWASTGTKNPNYSDTLYVDSLIGKSTVNTLPPQTLVAFIEHGTAADTLTKGLPQAARVMEQLAEVGIDLTQVTRQLQSDGVELFIDSFETLIAQVEAKRVILKTGIIARQKLALGIYREKVERAMSALETEHINPRLWNKDATVWKNNPMVMTKIVQRLGWLDVIQTIDIQRLKTLQARVKDNDHIQHVVLLGMGGSSLAPQVLFKTFGQQSGFPDLHILDTTDPAQINTVRDAVNLEKTLFIVASKSGGTIETLSLFKYFYEETGKNGQSFIAITDPNSPLEALARDYAFQDIFLNPADIGGRYSALSYFGMVPAALIGLDIDRLCREAGDMIEANGELIPVKDHPGVWFGTILGQMAQDGRDKLMIFASDSIASFAGWAEQLVAESTGKEGKGILPIAGATVGKPHDYGSDRMFVYMKLDGDPSNEELDNAVRVLREAGHPRVTYFLADRYALAGEFFRWEYATAIAGKMLGINPFDEPNVAEAKQYTNRLLEHYAEHRTLPVVTPFMQADDVVLRINETTVNPLRELCEAHNFDAEQLTELIAAQVVGTNAGDYFALLAYAPNTPTINEKLTEIQRQIRHYTRRAITVGYGPRYLHSTGQLHKGGLNNGVFFILTYDDPADLAIPEAGYSFGTLKAAQAAGDVQALQQHHRRTLHLHVTGDSIDPALDLVLKALESVASRRQ